MKLALALVGMTLGTAAGAQTLPGVSDEETTIRSGVIREIHKGHGDVVFVRDDRNKWYRLGLNEGCLKNSGRVSSVLVDTTGPTGEVDRMASLHLGDASPRNCFIESIRKSEAPPQVDSKSRITLD